MKWEDILKKDKKTSENVYNIAKKDDSELNRVANPKSVLNIVIFHGYLSS